MKVVLVLIVFAVGGVLAVVGVVRELRKAEYITILDIILLIMSFLLSWFSMIPWLVLYDVLTYKIKFGARK